MWRKIQGDLCDVLMGPCDVTEVRKLVIKKSVKFVTKAKLNCIGMMVYQPLETKVLLY